MRQWIMILAGALTFPIFLGLTCPTIDPPPPPRLTRPAFTQAEIVAKTDHAQQFHEAIRLHWHPPSTQHISIDNYCIIRFVAYDSSLKHYTVSGIDTTVDDLIAPLNIPRIDMQQVLYRVYAIDSLGRAGDTSVPCTVSLAPEVSLSHPANTLDTAHASYYLQWVIPQVIGNETISYGIVWKTDSCLWQSPSVKTFNTKIAKYPFPVSLYPFETGKYYWGVKLVVVGENDPTSFTIRHFYAP